MKKLLTILGILIAFISKAQTIQFLGSPTTQIYVRGQMRIDTLLYLPLRDTTFTPSQIGAFIVKGTVPYIWTGIRWTQIATGSPIWGSLTGNLTDQADLVAALGAKQDVISGGYGIKKSGAILTFDSAVVRKVDTLIRLNDSTVQYSINGITRSILIRGTAAGGINSLVLNAGGTPFNTPITFSNTGGAWSGSLVTASQNANNVWAGPTIGSPAQPVFRGLVTADLPTGIPNANLQNSTITYAGSTSGTDISITPSVVSLGGTVTVAIPNAGPSSRGALTSTDWNFFNGKVTSVNGQGGVVITKNADSIKTFPVDLTANRQNYLLTYDSTNHKFILTAGASAGVSSVALTAPSILNVGGSPITSSGTFALTLANQAANSIFSGPNGSTGTPTFRSFLNADLPTSGVSAGTYNSVTVNAQGIVTGGSIVGTGITSLNGLTGTTQTFATGTSGSDFNISSSGTAHTFNIPIADATHTGKVSSTDWINFNSKVANNGASNGIKAGTFASRPSASNTQTYYFSTDSAKWSYDNGAWIDVAGASGGGSTITTAQSITGNGASGTPAKLVNDVTTPLKWQYYGTTVKDSVRGYHDIEENFYGTLYNAPTWTSASTGFVNRGATVSLVSNKLQFTSGNASFSQTLEVSNSAVSASMLDKWFVCGTVKVGTKNATATEGFGFGKRSINAYGAPMALAKFVMSTTGGQVVLYGGTDSSQMAISSALSFSIGDSIYLSCLKDGYTITGTARNLTTNSASVTCTYLYSTNPIGNPVMDNTGRYSIFSFGGTFTVDSLVVSSNISKNARLAIPDDSKGQGYAVTAQQYRFADQLNNFFRSTINLSGGYDRTTEVSQRVYEIIALHPQQVIMGIGSNDVRSGVDSTTYCTRYDSITTALLNAGIDVYHAVMYESSVSMLPLWNHIQQVYPASKVINTYDPMKAAGALFSDLVHPNNLGDSIYANTIIQSYKLYAGNVRYSVNDNNFIRNQSLSAQSASYNINGSAVAGSYTAGTTKILGPVTSELPGNATLGTLTTGSGFLKLADSAAATDSKAVDLNSLGGHFYIDLLNDAASSRTHVMDVLRSGTTATSATFNTKTIHQPVSGVAMSVVPLANNDGLTVTNTVTGFMRPIAVTASATAGLQLFQGNTSTNAGAYSNINLSMAGSGSGSATIQFTNGTSGTKYYFGLNRNTDNFQLETGQNFFSEWSGTNLLIVKPTGQFFIGNPTLSINRMLTLKGTMNISKDSLTTSSAGTVMGMGIDTTTGDVVKFTPINTSSFKTNNDSVATTGYTSHGRTTQVLDSISLLNRLKNDTVAQNGTATNGHLKKALDSVLLIITSGTYTPTLTNTANLGSIVLSSASYNKVGNIVHVSIGGTFLPTVISTISTLTFSLPFTTATTTQSYVGSSSIAVNSGTSYVSGIVSINSSTTGTLNFVSGSIGGTCDFNVQFDFTL